jgi:aminopeptidase N
MNTRLIAFLLLIINYAYADTYPRNTSIDIKHYTFKIDLNDSTNVVSGEATIQFKVLNSIHDFEIDLANQSATKKGMVVAGVWMENNELKFSHVNNRLKISLPSAAKSQDILTVTIRYSGVPIDGLIISKNKFGDRTFFGDNWPNRAHNWLPCMDHPYDKASVDFIVTAPPHYSVIANGVKKEESYLNKKQKLTHWHEEIDIPTKVMVIGVAQFAIEASGTIGCVPVESWIYPQNREAGFIDYEPAAKILDFFQHQVGAYSYKKLANVQSTTIYGGMENASNIFYYENSVTGKQQINDLLAHEIAHQWFGNSASEYDWHHVWLSEGFATYFTQVYNEFTFGQSKAEEMRKAERIEVLNFNKKNPGPVINTSITNYVELLSPQVYQRGGWVLHMLRKEIGEDAFWNGIRDYYKT